MPRSVRKVVVSFIASAMTIVAIPGCSNVAESSVQTPSPSIRTLEAGSRISYILVDVGSLGGRGGDGSTAEAINASDSIVGTSDLPAIAR